jgi:hypothetical protein
LLHALRDELTSAEVVRVGLELDRDLRHSELIVGPYAACLRETGERRLHGDGYRGFEFLGSHGCVLHDHIEDRGRQIGKHVALKVLKRRDSERAGREHEDQRNEWFGG